MLAFVKNWQIDEEMTTDLDYEVIHFIILINKAEMIKNSLNSSYNTVKADWTKFANQLQQKLEKISNLVKNLENSLKDLKNIAISFRNLILNATYFKRKSFIKTKV